MLSAAYRLEEGSPHATACSGQASGLEWDYTTVGAMGIPATVSIVRVITKYDTVDVAASLVSTQVIGGREAIVVRPYAADGLAQTSKVIFPETFGKTAIQAFNLSEAELLNVAGAVVEATR